MQYKETKPCAGLAPYVHSFWELIGEKKDGRWERNFPDGCAGVVTNLGEDCWTDNGAVRLEYGKTYAVGAMTTYKDSFISEDTHLVGVCLKPATFGVFFRYLSQDQFTDQTVEFERTYSLDIDKLLADPFHYLNYFFLGKQHKANYSLWPVINDIHANDGQLSVHQLAQRNCMNVRQLERGFKKDVGMTPKAYSNIIRFQKVLRMINNPDANCSFLDIAFECGYYDHPHLTNEIKRKTGLNPSQL